MVACPLPSMPASLIGPETFQSSATAAKKAASCPDCSPRRPRSRGVSAHCRGEWFRVNADATLRATENPKVSGIPLGPTKDAGQILKGGWKVQMRDIGFSLSRPWIVDVPINFYRDDLTTPCHSRFLGPTLKINRHGTDDLTWSRTIDWS